MIETSSTPSTSSALILVQPKILSGINRFVFIDLSSDGQLRNINTGEPFQFEVKEGDRGYNQKHYEALGEVY